MTMSMWVFDYGYTDRRLAREKELNAAASNVVWEWCDGKLTERALDGPPPPGLHPWPAKHPKDGSK